MPYQFDSDPPNNWDSTRARACPDCGAPAGVQHELFCSEVDVGEQECPECGSPDPAVHDPMCPNSDVDTGPDDDARFDARRDLRGEGLTFDKFMDATLLREGKTRMKDATEVSAARRIARARYEHPTSKVKVIGGNKR